MNRRCPRVPCRRDSVWLLLRHRERFRARLVRVCRKSIQLAGFHGAKPGAIVPGIGIFTTPPPPPPPPRHAGERPAIITAISVSGIFQPFLVSPFLLGFIHFDGTTQRYGRYRENFPISQKFADRSREFSLYVLVVRHAVIL